MHFLKEICSSYIYQGQYVTHCSLEGRYFINSRFNPTLKLFPDFLDKPSTVFVKKMTMSIDCIINSVGALLGCLLNWDLLCLM